MLSVFSVTRAAFNAGAKLLVAQLRGVGAEGDDEGAEPVDDAAVLTQLGVAVRPLARRTLRALGYQDGDDVWVLKLWDREASPLDLDEGETRVYAAGAIATALRVLAGRIDVNAPQINLGGAATRGVNRQGDAIEPGALTVSSVPFPPPPAGPGGGTITITYTPPGGASQTIVVTLGGAVTLTPGTTTITLGGRTGPGSSKVRAED